MTPSKYSKRERTKALKLGVLKVNMTLNAYTKLGRFINTFRARPTVSSSEFTLELSKQTAGTKTFLQRNLFLMETWGWIVRESNEIKIIWDKIPIPKSD